MFGDKFSFDGVLKKMRPLSDDSRLGLEPSIGDAARQRLAIMDDDRVWFPQYYYGGIYHNPSPAEECPFHISMDAAGAILNAVIDTLCHAYEAIVICDIVSWNLTFLFDGNADLGN